MGTRAAFWIGDPRNIKSREWLGCKAFDGYPESFPLSRIKTEKQFREMVVRLSAEDDFAKPDGGWPYPWDEDIFLTDFTYAFFDGKLYMSCFHTGLMTPRQFKRRSEMELIDDPTLKNIPAPSKYNRNQPDSIIVVSTK